MDHAFDSFVILTEARRGRSRTRPCPAAVGDLKYLCPVSLQLSRQVASPVEIVASRRFQERKKFFESLSGKDLQNRKIKL
jgi:hypothetical protein